MTASSDTGHGVFKAEHQVTIVDHRRRPPQDHPGLGSPAALANFVPLVVERKPVLVKGSLADRLDAVEPQVALVGRLEARRDADRCRELRALRPIPGYF